MSSSCCLKRNKGQRKIAVLVDEEKDNLLMENEELKKEKAVLEKVVEIMADYIDLYCDCVDVSKSECTEAHCQNCIKNYFRKRVEGN